MKLKNLINLAATTITLSLGVVTYPAVSRAVTMFSPVKLEEGWSFGFEGYEIEHQGQSVIDLRVSYDYLEGIGVDDPFEYPDFTQIYNFIDNFLTTYPNETDFWEILNKSLVTELLTEPIPTAFGFDYQLANVLDSLTVEIGIKPGSSEVFVPRSSIVTGTPGTEVTLDESWSFAFKDYAVEHQGQSVIDLLVSYDYVEGIGENDPFEYPDFTQISNYVEGFLANYPNETDFWEILNKNLVTDLLTQPIPTSFGFDYQLANVLDSLTVEIGIKPGSSDVFVPRSSIVTGTPGTEVALDESWSFALKDYAIEHQGQSVIDLVASYDYVEGIGKDNPFEYPDFTQILNYVEGFLANYPNETDFWEILNKNLVTDLLTQPIPTEFGFDYQLAEVLESFTVAIGIQPGSSNIFIPRSSTVTGTPGTEVALDESWSFALENYAVEHQGQSVIDLVASYDYVEGIGKDNPFEYPDFTQISNYIQALLVNYPNETDFWEILNKNLVAELLTQPIPTEFGFDYQLAEVLDSLSLAIGIQPGSSNIFIPRSSNVTGTLVATAVPEPGMLLGLGCITIVGMLRRKA
ncbi:hypothetical protein VB834_05230 [Limnoraphis robusta Tam1]|uniref:hypothetical protein n=1 Tax=Limnoraphis robusta TaxID=1118279 RepID=UPI002B2058AA|nr:hypothetical protein [Limnoraphis robusta]MEA5496131.1 hypothetical protein [Limnoraphis robusta BA-68 BA1]MEA5538432.1 hypothetical protein [Limnoraphis robusta Tam1]